MEHLVPRGYPVTGNKAFRIMRQENLPVRVKRYSLSQQLREALKYGLIVLMAALLWANGFILPQSYAAEALSEQVRELLRSRIETVGVPSVTLPLFYERRAFWPAWSNDGGLLPQVDLLIKAIHKGDREGLRPADYHLAKIESTLEEIRQNQKRGKSLNANRLVDLDLLLTDAFLIYGSHLLAGRINPETIDAEWLANRREADLAIVLDTALSTSQIEESLEGLLPPQSSYERLRQALARYREIAERGGWPMVSDGPKMQRGDRSERVIALQTRLIATGDLDHRLQNDGEAFDDALEQAVLRFQRRHGLEADGVVGPSTLAALNVPVEARVRQIELNMERWRWLPQDLGKRYVLINIANFELDVFENSQSVMIMRIVVGRPYRRTPVFSDKMTYLVLSPYWHVPPSIAVQDILPEVRKNPDYLAKKNMKVFQGWGAETKEIDPKTIAWSTVTGKNFNYRFRQEPGPANALGRVKFMFPNKFNVYLHDTPARELFAKTERSFSSGCIRIEKPIELAEYVLRGDPKWTGENIVAATYRRVEQTVRLPEPILVHLLYWTAWVNEDGTIHFRNDIYGRDKLLDEAVREGPPSL